MPQNLFAACRIEGMLIAKHVSLHDAARQSVENMFDEQEKLFRKDVIREVDFDGGWKAETDELLTVDVSQVQEAQIFVGAINANTVAVPNIDTQKFDQENVKALFIGVSAGGDTKVLIQQFAPRHMLSRSRFSLILDGNSFRPMKEQAFAFDTSLAGIVENGKLKFKSFQKIKAIFNLIDIYEAATDSEVQDFAQAQTFYVANMNAFMSIADQTTTRKLIHAVMHRGTLKNYSANEIEQAANKVGVSIKTNNGRIIMPEKSVDLRELLRFLDDGLYEAPLSGKRYITNSKKPL